MLRLLMSMQPKIRCFPFGVGRCTPVDQCVCRDDIVDLKGLPNESVKLHLAISKVDATEDLIFLIFAVFHKKELKQFDAFN